MFSKLAFANSKRNRRDSGLFFGAMVIAVVAIYMLLSFFSQDVMRFLQQIESEAVRRLMSIVPVFYLASLAILTFLIYFAAKLQIERRRHEFGLYLTLGMRRGRLLKLLLLEDLGLNLQVLLVGLPLGILLSEVISLVTARVVGLGIIGHRFVFSLPALGLTLLGFLAVKFFVMLILAGHVVRRELGTLLLPAPAGSRRQLAGVCYALAVAFGLVLLAWAYRRGTGGAAWQSLADMGWTILAGCLGTISLFFGLRWVIEGVVKIERKRKLHVFIFRQIQEAVVNRSGLLAACSLLIFLALSLFGAGLTISFSARPTEEKSLDYTFYDNNQPESQPFELVRKKLTEAGLLGNFQDLFELKIALPAADEALDLGAVATLARQAGLPANSSIVAFTAPDRSNYLLPLSNYNRVLLAAGEAEISLKENEVALYMDRDFLPAGAELEAFYRAQSRAPVQVRLVDQDLTLKKQIYSPSIVTDRSITLGGALIVPDDLFDRYAGDNVELFVNAVLQPELVEQQGLLQAIMEMNKALDQTGLHYESYLQNMGRYLFYAVSASYMTIYLAILFLVIANTMIGVLYLMGQERAGRRYQTLIYLGATWPTLRQAAYRQINWFFGLPLVLGLANTFFGIQSIFKGLSPRGAEQLAAADRGFLTAGVVGLLLLVEVAYLFLVKQSSGRHLRRMMKLSRTE